MNEKLKEKLVYFDAETANTSLEEAVSLNSLLKEKESNDQFDATIGAENSDDIYRELNLKLDKKTKYLHDQDYYVKSYNSNKIFIDKGQIVYEDIDKIPADASKDSIIRQNLFEQALLMLSIYMGFVDNLNSNFVRENFSDFGQFVPEDDLGYYSGIIERNAGIYYNDFAKTKSEKKLNEYQEALHEEEKKTAPNSGSSGVGSDRTLTKATAASKLYAEPEEKPTAFVTVYFYAAVTMVGFLLGVLYLFTNVLR